MKKLQIFDNKGKSYDQYTAITPSGDMYTFSDNPYHPCGVGSFIDNINNMKIDSFDHLGEAIKLKQLPAEAQRFIKSIL